MSSTFGSLNIAKSGLMYQQIAIDTANNNIANVNTDGYTRRRAVAGEVGGPDQPTMWSSYDGHGQGVTTQAVQRLSDVLLGNRVRGEHANLSNLQVQQTSMERVEAAINEPSDNGVAATIADFAASWQDVVTTPDGVAARQSVIASGQTLAAAINGQARALDAETEEQRSGAVQDVSTINQDAQKLAQLNHTIYLARANGGDTGDLEDQRDQVALELANTAGAVTTVDPATGNYDVTISDTNGAPVDLVKGASYGAIVGGKYSDGTQSVVGGNNPPAFAVTALVGYDQKIASGTAAASPNLSLGGDLGGVSMLLSSTLPDYRQKLNDLATNIASVVNAQHANGLDQHGAVGGEFFSVSADDPAGSIAVTIADPTKVATAVAPLDATGQPIAGTASNDSTNADRISRALSGGPLLKGADTSVSITDAAGNLVSSINIGDQYQRMVSDLGSTVAGLNTRTANQQLLTNQVDDQREQTAGVSLDEETINLMQAQRAYEASSRVLNVMNSILDTLINHTGV